MSSNSFIDKLVDSLKIDEIRISPAGNRVAYTVAPFGQDFDKPNSSIWLADVGISGSSRQLTSGYYDHSLQWFPDGTMICFLSNKGEGPSGLYGTEAGENTALFGFHERVGIKKLDVLENVSKFYFSPDGRRIAFLAPDEKDLKEISGGDVEVFGKWKYTRPYLLDLSTFEITKLYNNNAQIEQITWSPDGTRILLVVHQSPKLDSAFISGIRFESISIDGTSTPEPAFICDFPGPVLSDQPIWINEDEIFFLSGATIKSTNSSMMVYRLKRDNERWSWSRYLHGEVDCAVDLRSYGGRIFLEVQSGLSDEICLLGTGNTKEDLVLYSENESINTWDSKFQKDGSCVLAMSKTNTICPLELFTVRLENLEGNTRGMVDEGWQLVPLAHASDLTQITNHNADLINAFDLKISSKVITCKSGDGTTDLDAIFVAPTTTPSKPLPTCVLIHGGAYDRCTFAFNQHSNYHNWQALLLSFSISSDPQNIAMLSPNYRGGSARGEKFASALPVDGLGTVEYDDIITLVSEGIKLGLVDPERIVVGGWSQGGILSYLLTTRRNLEAAVGDWKIKGAIIGPGGSDIDTLVMTSDRPYMQAEGIGGAPWEAGRDDTISKNASAIKRMRKKGAAEAMPKVLIIHGKEDKRIPVSQAIAFREACQGLGVGEKVEMVIYPKEVHMITQRTHLIDMLERVERFCRGLLN